MLDLTALDKIANGTALSDITKDEMTAVQRGLAICGYSTDGIDGLYGPRTRAAFDELVAEIKAGQPDIITKAVIEYIEHRKTQLSSLLSEASSGGTKQQVQQQIGQMFTFLGLSLKAQIAYGLATADWETAHTFKPVREAFWEPSGWRKKNLRYYPYYGRGYVQLTWKRNYSYYGDILGVDMVADPDLALRPDIALFVIGYGMKTGSFTGAPLAQYVNKAQTDFLNARRVINGTNKASEIAALAEGFLKDLGQPQPAVVSS